MAPKFPKPKDEGWFLILGDAENRELLALKRVPFVGARANHTLAFQTPEQVRRQRGESGDTIVKIRQRHMQRHMQLIFLHITSYIIALFAPAGGSLRVDALLPEQLLHRIGSAV